MRGRGLSVPSFFLRTIKEIIFFIQFLLIFIFLFYSLYILFSLVSVSDP
nr:MAG TPA: hypothetical protein [Bacteriophage sp.]